MQATEVLRLIRDPFEGTSAGKPWPERDAYNGDNDAYYKAVINRCGRNGLRRSVVTALWHMGTIDMEGGLSSCINAATALSRQILRNGADPAPLEQLYLKFNTAAMVFAPNSALGTDNLAVLYQEIMPLVSAVGIPESVVQNLMPAV